jgi:hypothetical protein
VDSSGYQDAIHYWVTPINPGGYWVTTYINPEGEVTGRQALSDQAQKLLDSAPADFALEEDDGPGYVGTDTAALAWRFGPPGSPVARGIDIGTIRDGRVSVLRTLLAAETDV